MSSKWIYIVEDDKNIREMEQYALENSGFQVKGFDDGKSYFRGNLNEKNIGKTRDRGVLNPGSALLGIEFIFSKFSLIHKYKECISK